MNFENKKSDIRIKAATFTVAFLLLCASIAVCGASIAACGASGGGAGNGVREDTAAGVNSAGTVDNGVNADSVYTVTQIAECIAVSFENAPVLYPLYSGEADYMNYLSDIYDIDADTVGDGVICYAGGIEACELAVLYVAGVANANDAGVAGKTVDAGSAVANAQTKLGVYRERREAVFTGYAPEQAALVKRGKVLRHGEYVAFIICENPDVAGAVFESCFGKNPPAPPESPVFTERKASASATAVTTASAAEATATATTEATATATTNAAISEAAASSVTTTTETTTSTSSATTVTTAVDTASSATTKEATTEKTTATPEATTSATATTAAASETTTTAATSETTASVTTKSEITTSEATASITDEYVANADGTEDTAVVNAGGAEDAAVENGAEAVQIPLAEDAYDPAAILKAWNGGDKNSLTYKNRMIYDACAAVIGSVIKKGMSEYDKELAIHDYIIGWADYDREAASNAPDAKPDPDNDNPYGTLMNKKAICKGYTLTFQLFMDMLGIECITVDGTAHAGEDAHAWNMVRLDGDWYCVDVTWDDPVGSGNMNIYVYHRFFNVTSQHLRDNDHQWNERGVPEATATDYAWKPK